MRLIDADALDKSMCKFSNATGEDMTHAIFYAHIAPTIDAVPVIRCKDCKYWNGSGKYCDYEMSGLEDDFCSWAERRNNDKTD